MSHHRATGDAGARIKWSRPREWRRHQLSDEPYWVEEEVVLVRGSERLAQLSFEEPLGVAQRDRYDRALRLQAGGSVLEQDRPDRG